MSTLYSTHLLRPADVDSFDRAPVLSLNVTLAPYHHIQEAIIAAAKRRESRTACFANVHMTVEATNDPSFATVVNGADWVLTDGLPLTWALRLQEGIRQDRVTGNDLMLSLLARAVDEQLPVFFYGSTPDVLAKAVAICLQQHPTLQIAGTLSPPFRDLSAAEDGQIIDQINSSGARLVFVALGCPKQERWMADRRGRVQAVMLGIGGALPMLAGTKPRAPRWLQQIGLEWAYRLAQEPRRLFRRYAITNSQFLLGLARQSFQRS